MTNWDDIRFFLAVAREGTVSGAALRLGVNHTTVARRIQNMEDKHGVKLFNRQRDGYELTNAGSLILDQATSMEDTGLEISRALLGQDQRLDGKVNITMPHDIFEYCLAEELATFRRQHPSIELNLMVSKGLRNLAVMEADIAVRLTSAPPEYLVGRPVASLQHAIYAHSRHDSVRPGLILWEGQGQGQGLPDWACKHFEDPYIAMTVDDLTSMYASVKAGIGIARMPCYLPDSIACKEVIKLPIEQPRSDWSVWVLNHIDLRQTARVQLCKRFLVNALKDKQKLFEGLRVDRL